MFFFNRKKREKNFEKKFRELNATILSEKDYKNSKKIEQYVVERLEQLIGVTKEFEEQKSEYRMITSYLNDIQMLEDMPAEERKKISDIAMNVVQLNAARTEFLNSAKKLSDAQFVLLEQSEEKLPDAIRRLTENEAYRDMLKKDLKYLDREKSEWILRREYLSGQQKRLKYLLYILVGTAATLAVTFGILQLIFEMDFHYAWMGLLLVTAVLVSWVFLRIQNDASELSAAERNQNRAILLENRVKIKYVGIESAVGYACEKYHVQNAAELNKQWGYYLEAVKEREKYQRTNEDLDYFNGRLVRVLSGYKLYDARVWVGQAAALVDPKEMVEVKHDLIGRRQKVREQIMNNLRMLKEQKAEAEQLLDKVGPMRPQVEQILFTIDKLCETS